MLKARNVEIVGQKLKAALHKAKKDAVIALPPIGTRKNLNYYTIVWTAQTPIVAVKQSLQPALYQ